jgi:peptidoglycan/LPS O-acetylase OafA/YrhL
MPRELPPHRKPIFYRPELDALRFAAFLFVFLHHALFILDPSKYTGLKASVARLEWSIRENMAFGVCLFFFLSAYLITTLLLKERAGTGTIHMRSFYLRRILRIWPLYFTFILVSLVIGYFAHIYTPKGQIFALIFLMGNWYTARYDWQGATAFAVLWSISIEEQFYLFWPWLAKLFRRQALLILCAMFAAISFGAVYWLKAHGVGWYYGIWTNSFTQLQFFAYGGLLALVLQNRVFHTSKWLRVALVLGGLTCWFLSRARPVVTASPLAVAFGYFLVAAGCVCFFLSVFGIEARYVPRWTIYLGKISYGLYIFHGLPLHVAWRLGGYLKNFPSAVHIAGIFVLEFFALLATIGIAAISYQYLEKPWLRLKSKYEYINTRTVGLTPAAVSSGKSWWQDRPTKDHSAKEVGKIRSFGIKESE